MLQVISEFKANNEPLKDQNSKKAFGAALWSGAVLLFCKAFTAAFSSQCCNGNVLSTKDSSFLFFCADIIIPENGEPVSSKDIKCCIKQIQELIISRLNQAVANKLISSVDYLRESFVGTLERCLKSLEESWEVSVHPARNLEKSKDVSVHITSNYLKQVQWLRCYLECQSSLFF